MSEPSEENKPVSLSQPEELIDRTIGEFRLLRRLGAGGMAQVYLAEQPSLERVVAVKVLQPDRVSGLDDSMVQRFEREARAAGGLSHSNIVQIYQTGEDQGIHYIVQEYVQGNNLAQQVKREGPPELQQGLQWMAEIADALHAAGEAGIVHRDIKPENIMLTRNLAAKVADFGLAQLNQHSDQKNLTQTGTTMGTPLYMSPEQIRGEQVDHRSDQYSFGVTLYHMFAGRPPFATGNSVTIAVQHLQDEATPLGEHRADLPSALCDVIHQMMSKKPADRFQTTQEVRNAVSRVKDLPVNVSLQRSEGVVSWIRDVVPAWRGIIAGLVITTGLGAIAGRALSSAVQLPDVPETVVIQRDTAAAQFAAAMLNRESEAAWKAVQTFFPESDEAQYARLHLGLLHLQQIPAESDRAVGLFDDVAKWTRSNPDEYRGLRALTLMAQAYAAANAGEKSAERSYLEQLRDEELLEREEEEELAEKAPRVLRSFWLQQLQDGRRGDDDRGRFGAGPPNGRGGPPDNVRGGPGMGPPDRRGGPGPERGRRRRP